MPPARLPDGVTPGLLRVWGEWAALGFYEAAREPWPRPYGRAFLRLYENIGVRVPEEHCLIPMEPLPEARTMASHGVWTATALIMDFNHDRGWRVSRDIVEAKKRRFPVHAAAIDSLARDLERRLSHFGGYTHSNPDMRRIVDEGFGSMLVELDDELDAVLDSPRTDRRERDLLLALKDYAQGVRVFHQRTVVALRDAERHSTGERKKMLARIQESFARCFIQPSQTFFEGLLAVNFAWMLDGCDSIGRFDQVLGELFEKDLAAGRLDIEFARQLLDELWQSFERLNGWNLQIGGRTPDGADGVNQLTYECLAACERNHCRRPNVAFRITSDTPDKAVLEALRVLSRGGGRPALYNDDLYMQALMDMDLGLTIEDARELSFGGCTEAMIGGMSNVGSIEGYLNLARALELALFDGIDPVNGGQVGAHTGRFNSFIDFSEFVQAVKEQIRFLTKEFVSANRGALGSRFHEGDPKLYRTLFTRDCVKRRKSFEAGGARYNWCVVSYQGIANLIDGLAAVRRCVFGRGGVSADGLLSALKRDFEGCEATRRKLLAAPKFGNDDLYVDKIGAEVLDFAWRTLASFETPRGGRYVPSCILFATYVDAGKAVGATPDGRLASSPLTDSVGPAPGRDTQGPTAMLNSVTQLPLTLAAGTPVLNLRFEKNVMASGDGVQAVADLVKGYFAKGGLQAQISVISLADMEAARAEPDKYADLIVRIGGYSEYYTRLTPELQESVMRRSEHGA